MKVRLTTVTMALVSVPALSQGVHTGVSYPDPVIISAQADEAAPTRAAGTKPSAAISETCADPARPLPRPLARPPAKQEPSSRTGQVYGAYVPYRGASAGANADGVNGDGANGAAAAANPDAMVVTSVEDHPGEVREGTLLRARIRQSLSTVTAVPGTMFTATLSEAVEKDGRIVLPIGSTIGGRVTQVHGGRRITGAATLHLQAKNVTLPDGTHYVIRAQLIDTDQMAHTLVDREGTLVRRDHPRQTLAALGLTTGGAAAAGGVIGGGVGAAVGAGIGAGAGAIWWLKQDRQAVLPADSLLVFSLTAPMPVMPVSSNPIRSVDAAGVLRPGQL